MQHYLKIFIVAALFSSCDEATELDLRQTPSKIVIEGLVTNKPGYQSVKVSRSADFYSAGQTPRVENAVVRVTDDEGQTYNFVHNPSGDSDSLGIYIPEVPFTGTIGKTYSLSVLVDGQEYRGSDQLLSVIPIDSLAFRINEDEQDDPKENGKFYELLLFAREPQDEKNYYLFKYYRNDSLVYYNETDIYFSDDVVLGEKIDGVPSPVFYGADDVARLEVYSLSRQGYVFYSDLVTILNNDGGGMFGSIPAPPRSNLTNGALGFFQVSAVHEREKLIE